MSLIIRPLTAQDYDAMVAIWQQAGLEYKPAGRDARDAFERQLQLQGDLMLGAEQDGRLAGVLLGSHDGRKAWINRMAVLPELRRQGVAGAMIRGVEAVCSRLGLPVYAALIEQSNTSSRALFESLGYTSLDTIKYYSKRLGDDV